MEALLDRWLPTREAGTISTSTTATAAARPGRGPLRADPRRAGAARLCRLVGVEPFEYRARRAGQRRLRRGLPAGRAGGMAWHDRAALRRHRDRAASSGRFACACRSASASSPSPQGRQAFVRVRVRLDDGREGWGVAAETLAAKWFDKNPALTDAENQDQLRQSLELAGDGLPRGAGRRPPSASSPTTTATSCAPAARRPARRWSASFGRALVDRARPRRVLPLLGVSFLTAMRSNLGGHGAACRRARPRRLRLHRVPRRPAAGARRIEARHTVGLVDPITAADQPPAARRRRPARDARGGRRGLRPALLQAEGRRRPSRPTSTGWCASPGCSTASPGRCHVSLDGNEQYEDVEAVVELWRRDARPSRALQRLCAAILFIEQPIKRAVALARGIAALARAGR